jgi:hypothetical protein
VLKWPRIDPASAQAANVTSYKYKSIDVISASILKFLPLAYTELAMSFRNVFYLLLLLSVGAASFSFQKEDKTNKWFEGSIRKLAVKEVGKRFEGIMQLPIFTSIGLYLSPFIKNAGAVTYEPILPPSYPLAVRSPYLSGIRRRSPGI